MPGVTLPIMACQNKHAIPTVESLPCEHLYGKPSTTVVASVNAMPTDGARLHAGRPCRPTVPGGHAGGGSATVSDDLAGRPFWVKVLAATPNDSLWVGALGTQDSNSVQLTPNEEYVSHRVYRARIEDA